jgi:hypothetical protein
MVYGMDALRLLVSKAGIARGEHAVDGLLVKCGGKDEPVIVGIQLHHSGGVGHGIALESQFLDTVHIGPSDGVQRINLYDYGRAFADDGVLEQGVLLQRIGEERIGQKAVRYKSVWGERHRGTVIEQRVHGKRVHGKRIGPGRQGWKGVFTSRRKAVLLDNRSVQRSLGKGAETYKKSNQNGANSIHSFLILGKDKHFQYNYIKSLDFFLYFCSPKWDYTLVLPKFYSIF